ncbi:MAG: D-alanyl-D-alanine carboxypeptidase [Thermaerobacter sp.]|nr:D-alanyl-D-alanine carboxypeptidase [Thermaerobacter sp.]
MVRGALLAMGLAGFGLSPAVQAALPAAPPPPSLAASAAILIDGRTGQILYGRNIRGEYYPASITKIMTAYLAITRAWNRTVTVSPAASSQIGSSCYLRSGETDPMSAVVDCMMLVSGNDAAYAVAQTVSGHVAPFVQLMNATARSWHAPGIHFANPSGLPNPHHVVTALGMAIIAQHAMQNPIFRTIVKTRVTTLPPDPGPRIYYNQNRLLYTYPGALGIKIGYTIEADETIVAAADRNGMYLIEVLLHDTPNGLWPDAAHLLTWGFDHFHAATLIRARQSLGVVKVGGGRPVPVVSAAAVSYLVPDGVAHPAWTLRRHLFLLSANRAIRAGQQIGTATVLQGDKPVGRIILLAQRAIAPLPPHIRWRWPWLIVPVVVFAAVRGRRRSVRGGHPMRPSQSS